MQRRNWLELSRKLVDKTDLDYTLNAIQDAIGEASLSFFGEGVLATTIYPNPFPISLSGSLFQGTVGNGIGYDANGNQIRIDTASTTNKNFNPIAADPSLPRWDLLVLEYTMTGDTPVPKPSDPITTINLNLHDDFIVKVIAGTPSATPSYPAKGANDLIIAGLRIPANATLGSQITLDLGVREIAIANAVNVPVFKQEPMSGAIDGSNKIFSTTELPFNAQSLLVVVDDRALSASEFSYTAMGTYATVTLVEAPAPGQDVKCFYVENSLHSQNPISGEQETPSGVINGINDTFTLLGKPADQASTLVFVDGRLIDSSKWSLVQGSLQSSIKFSAGNIPATAQSVYVYYFVNAATVGVGGGGGGSVTAADNLGTGHGVYASQTGSVLDFKSLVAGAGMSITETADEITLSSTITAGDGRFSVYGAYNAGEVVDPSVGIVKSSLARQLHFLISQGGAQAVTANPQIPAGDFVGQEIMLKGTSDTDYVILNDGSGLALNGPINLKNKIGIYLLWDGEVWSENGRP